MGVPTQTLKVGLLALAAVAVVAVRPSLAKDYLVAVSHPNTVHLIDLEAREVVKSHAIPGDGAPIAITVTPTGKVAYVLTNRYGSVAGINMETGEQVFRADMSEGDVRVRTMAAIAVSADGKELFVYQAPVRLKPAEYEVLDTRIAVYDTSAGVGAQPVRMLPVPRATMVILPSPDGKFLYVINVDLFKLDAQTGEILETVPIAHWDHPDYEETALLAKWLAPNATGIYLTPVFAVRKGVDPELPEAHATLFMSVNPATGEVNFKEIERGGPIIFSVVQNPARTDQVHSVYLELSKVDMAEGRVAKRIRLPHTYYDINVASDGGEIYLGGTMNDIAVYDPETLERLATINLPEGVDQSLGFIRLVQW